MTTQGRPRAQDLHARLSPELYGEAYKRGMSFSAYLESIDPSDGYGDGLDAFSRQLRCANIRTQTMPEYGVYADTFGALVDSEQGRVLAPEWMARQWRRAATGRDVSTRSLYVSSDNAQGSAINPFASAAQARQSQQIAPAIPLAELIAITSPISGGAYQAFYLTNNTSEQRMARVAEGTDVPGAKLTGGNHMIRLKKYGRALEISYEQLRRMRFDLIALHIARMAVQAESDKVAAVIDILVSGDGNANTAATSYNLTDLDSAATAGTLTLKGWLSFKMKFSNPYMATVALAQEAVALQMLLLNSGSANVPLIAIQGGSGFGSFRQINPGLADGVGLGWTSDAPSLKIVAADSRFAVEQVTEIGSQLSEVERYVRRQTEEVVMTEVEGYCTFDPSAAKVLDVNA